MPTTDLSEKLRSLNRIETTGNTFVKLVLLLWKLFHRNRLTLWKMYFLGNCAVILLLFLKRLAYWQCTWKCAETKMRNQILIALRKQLWQKLIICVSHIGQAGWSSLVESLLSSWCSLHILDIKESIRRLTLLIWAHLVVLTIILSLIAIIIMLWKFISYKRRRKMSRHVKHFSQVVCDKGVSG